MSLFQAQGIPHLLLKFAFTGVAGHNMSDDQDMLDDMVLGMPHCQPMTGSAWQTPYFITPQHAVWQQWNEATLQQHCASKKKHIFICMVKQTMGGRPLSLWERHVVASSQAEGGGGRGKGKLLLEVEIAIGAKVLVTRNLETNLDITNGARGKIVGIVLSANKRDYGDAVMTRTSLPFITRTSMDP